MVRSILPSYGYDTSSSRSLVAGRSNNHNHNNNMNDWGNTSWAAGGGGGGGHNNTNLQDWGNASYTFGDDYSNYEASYDDWLETLERMKQARAEREQAAAVAAQQERERELLEQQEKDALVQQQEQEQWEALDDGTDIPPWHRADNSNDIAANKPVWLLELLSTVAQKLHDDDCDDYHDADAYNLSYLKRYHPQQLPARLEVAGVRHAAWQESNNPHHKFKTPQALPPKPEAQLVKQQASSVVLSSSPARHTNNNHNDNTNNFYETNKHLQFKLTSVPQQNNNNTKEEGEDVTSNTTVMEEEIMEEIFEEIIELHEEEIVERVHEIVVEEEEIVEEEEHEIMQDEFVLEETNMNKKHDNERLAKETLDVNPINNQEKDAIVEAEEIAEEEEEEIVEEEHEVFDEDENLEDEEEVFDDDDDEEEVLEEEEILEDHLEEEIVEEEENDYHEEEILDDPKPDNELQPAEIPTTTENENETEAVPESAINIPSENHDMQHNDDQITTKMPSYYKANRGAVIVSTNTFSDDAPAATTEIEAVNSDECEDKVQTKTTIDVPSESEEVDEHDQSVSTMPQLNEADTSERVSKTSSTIPDLPTQDHQGQFDIEPKKAGLENSQTVVNDIVPADNSSAESKSVSLQDNQEDMSTNIDKISVDSTKETLVNSTDKPSSTIDIREPKKNLSEDNAADAVPWKNIKLRSQIQPEDLQASKVQEKLHQRSEIIKPSFVITRQQLRSSKIWEDLENKPKVKRASCQVSSEELEASEVKAKLAQKPVKANEKASMKAGGGLCLSESSDSSSSLSIGELDEMASMKRDAGIRLPSHSTPLHSTAKPTELTSMKPERGICLSGPSDLVKSSNVSGTSGEKPLWMQRTLELQQSARDLLAPASPEPYEVPWANVKLQKSSRNLSEELDEGKAEEKTTSAPWANVKLQKRTRNLAAEKDEEEEDEERGAYQVPWADFKLKPRITVDDLKSSGVTEKLEHKPVLGKPSFVVSTDELLHNIVHEKLEHKPEIRKPSFVISKDELKHNTVQEKLEQKPLLLKPSFAVAKEELEHNVVKEKLANKPDITGRKAVATTQDVMSMKKKLKSLSFMGPASFVSLVNSGMDHSAHDKPEFVQRALVLQQSLRDLNYSERDDTEK